MITTADFMQNNVAYIHEMVPGSKIDINMESFARLNPLPVPTFGRASMRNRAFFVPFRTIFRGWTDYITDAPHIWSNPKSDSSILLDTVPTVANNELAELFLERIATDLASVQDGDLLYVAGEPPTFNPLTDAYDFVYNNQFLSFTQQGRQYLKVLESLGYKISWDTFNLTQFSALPLLALGKIACDWYFAQPYTGTALYNSVMRLCNADTGYLYLTAVDVKNILDISSYVMYDSDYFVSAFDTPNQPVSSAHTDFKLVNIDSIGQVFGTGSTAYSISLQNGVSNRGGNAITSGDAVDRYGRMDAPFITGYLQGGSSGTQVVTGGISEYLLHSLHALTDYMKRHQLAGSRAFDRYLARFGKALPAEKLNKSVYLGAAMQDIKIGDVMSTADTEGAQLGAYSGKGMSYGNGHFDFSTDEYGYLIIMSSIVPATGYFQGVDRQVLRINKSQFYTPEFDSLGNQPVTAAELYISQNPSTTGSDQYNIDAYNQVFGFTPRYADYKVAHDNLTGNFRIPSLNGSNGLTTPLGFNGADSWHLMRTFDDRDFWGANTMDATKAVHSLNFMQGKDWSQYKRIFYGYATGGDAPVVNEQLPDNFTVIHNFEIAEYAPMKPLYDTYEFEDKGKKVTLDVNGVKMN